MTLKIRSRSEALAAQATKYFTGKPCVRGHTVERYTSTSTCVRCAADAQQKFKGLRMRGLVPLECRVHPDDRDAVMAFVTKLAADRLLAKPPEHTIAGLTVAETAQLDRCRHNGFLKPMSATRAKLFALGYVTHDGGRCVVTEAGLKVLALPADTMPDGPDFQPFAPPSVDPPPPAPVSPCSVCAHPTQWGHDCQVCGTVMAPDLP